MIISQIIITIIVLSIAIILCSKMNKQKKYKFFSNIGIIINIYTAIWIILITWDIIEINIFNADKPLNSFQEFFTLIILSLSSANISFILNINTKKNLVKIGTIISSVILDILLLICFWGIITTYDLYVKILGLIIIITMTGTILTIKTKNKEQSTTTREN